MKVLVVGSGGREHALAWRLANSPSVSQVISAPGNPGMAELGEVVPVDAASPESVAQVAERFAADLVVVGPEAPLVAGVGDLLREKGFPVFGPDAPAARIEGSKAFAKRLMVDAGVPTGAARSFTELEPAIAYIDELGPPYVIKADGLAAGKGVVVTSDRDEAIAALRERLVDRAFGDAGATVLIEEYLDGPEASLITFSDGRSVVCCEPAQDYKRIFDGDRGPNTGGMGSYSPVPVCPPEVSERIVHEVLRPIVAEMGSRGTPFIGALYAGLALTKRGVRVVEFNARFGDPETQALMPRFDSDLGEVCFAAATGELEGVRLRWSNKACVSVVLASDGYPASQTVGVEIAGVREAGSVRDAVVFHAGTKLDGQRLETAGGRVLAVSALGNDFSEARKVAYEAASMIRFEGKQMRGDIGERAIVT
ncbi:MAG: phosphoribosylamine--glycine ligase [Actinomycetota bacterium]